jgi:hypothetical protein
MKKLEIKDSSEFWPKIEPLNDDFGRLIDHMRDSLAAIEIVETRLHNQPQLNEARTSGDEKSTKSRGST